MSGILGFKYRQWLSEYFKQIGVKCILLAMLAHVQNQNFGHRSIIVCALVRSLNPQMRAGTLFDVCAAKCNVLGALGKTHDGSRIIMYI